MYPEDALDQDWSWLGIWLPCQAMPDQFECYSALVRDELHGLMATDLRGKMTPDGRALVVDHLATSPHDRRERLGYKYIGVALMAVAVTRSIELGFGGLIWLEALPDTSTLKFYTNIGMTRQLRPSADGNDIFIFESDRALEFLTLATRKKWVSIANQQ